MKEKGTSPLVIAAALGVVLAIGVGAYFVMQGDEGGEGPTEVPSSLVECTGTCMKDFATIFDALLGVLEVVDQPLRTPRSGVSYNRVAYTFGVDQDLDNDLLLETRVYGTINAGLGTELSDGMQPVLGGRSLACLGPEPQISSIRAEEPSPSGRCRSPHSG